MKYNTKENFKAVVYIGMPIIISYLLWWDFMNPISYWQKLISVLGSAITWIIVFYIEIEVLRL